MLEGSITRTDKQDGSVGTSDRRHENSQLNRNVYSFQQRTPRPGHSHGGDDADDSSSLGGNAPAVPSRRQWNAQPSLEFQQMALEESRRVADVLMTLRMEFRQEFEHLTERVKIVDDRVLRLIGSFLFNSI